MLCPADLQPLPLSSLPKQCAELQSVFSPSDFVFNCLEKGASLGIKDLLFCMPLLSRILQFGVRLNSKWHLKRKKSKRKIRVEMHLLGHVLNEVQLKVGGR